MINRKLKLIDKNFQLRTVFSITIVAMVFFIIVILAIIIFSVNSKSNISQEIASLEKTIETENNIITAFTTYNGMTNENSLSISIDTVKKDHAASMDTVSKHISMLEHYTDNYFYLLIITIGIMFTVVVIFYFQIIRITHRISGPIFVMSRYIQEIIEGKDPHFRNLRDNDEFKDFYQKIIDLVEKFKKEGKYK